MKKTVRNLGLTDFNLLFGGMFLAGIGVLFFIISGVRWASMQKLLKEGELAPREKRKNRIKDAIGTVVMCLCNLLVDQESFCR